VLGFVRDALAGGAGGIAMGRNVFQSADPERLAGKVARLVHQFPGEDLEDLMGGRHDDRRKVVLA
jgi:2-amino-4,5-dihydroxy-6-oxo-7-(phosphooxy)heptanoate synthase